jgi:phage shock protein C
MAKEVKRLVRPEKGRWVAGVCLALANYFNVDVTVIRIIWAFLLFPGGIPGLLPYIILWIIIPSEKK